MTIDINQLAGPKPPPAFISNGMGDKGTAGIIGWALRHSLYARYAADLDAGPARIHDWEWSREFCGSDGGTIENFEDANDRLRRNVLAVTGSGFLSQRVYNAVSFVGYDGYPWRNETERQKAVDAAGAFWAGRSQSAGILGRQLCVFVSTLGLVGASQAQLDAWVKAIVGAIALVPAVLAFWHSLQSRGRLASAKPKESL